MKMQITRVGCDALRMAYSGVAPDLESRYQ